MSLADAKADVLRQCTARIERDLRRLAESLAADGYGTDEILAVIETHRPAFDEAIKQALRTVTIMDLLASANDG